MRDKERQYHQDQPATYHIQVLGSISQRWSRWFDDLTITVEKSGELTVVTTIAGTITDQAALLGLLQKLYSLGFPLLEVRRLGEEYMSISKNT